MSDKVGIRPPLTAGERAGRSGEHGQHAQHGRARDVAWRARHISTNAPPRHRSLPETDVASSGVKRTSTGRRALFLGCAVTAVALVAVTAGTFALTRPGETSTPVDAPRALRPLDFPAVAPHQGVYVTSTLRPDGSLVSDQWVMSKRPMMAVDLEMASADGARGFRPSVTRLSVVADGQQVAAVPRSDPSRPRTSIALSQPATYVHLRYVVSGVAVIADSRVAPPGRAVVLINGVRLGSAAVGEQVVRVVGDGVLSLSCRLGDSSPVPCGTDTDGQWAVELAGSAASTSVFAQVDLPKSHGAGARLPG